MREQRGIVTYRVKILDNAAHRDIINAYKFRSAVGLERVIHPLFFYSSHTINQ